MREKSPFFSYFVKPKGGVELFRKKTMMPREQALAENAP